MANSHASFWQNVSKPVPFDTKKFMHILTAPEFPEAEAKQWMNDRFPLTLQVSIAYVLVVFGTQFLMRNRPPFSLFIPLNAWNLFLAIFSTVGSMKLTPEFFSTLWNHGFQSSYCHVHDYTGGTTGYWVWLFITSKMFELVDTVFLVLRKRPLLFLHWYHHILTMVYAYYSYPIMPAFNRWGIYLNFFVHSYMYSYYFMRSMKIRVPGPVAKFVTTIQIWQFIISVAILCHLGWIVFVDNVSCDLDSRVFTFAVAMDVSYLILFINFFLHAYVFGGGKSKYREEQQKKKPMVVGDEQAHMSKQYEEQRNGTLIDNSSEAVRRDG
uniref:Elongation of very long chain fatty acids protein n=1 Tax=Globodera rostochiensis TaxID=31243 RepID=A0A914H877_GLORO